MHELGSSDPSFESACDPKHPTKQQQRSEQIVLPPHGLRSAWIVHTVDTLLLRIQRTLAQAASCSVSSTVGVCYWKQARPEFVACRTVIVPSRSNMTHFVPGARMNRLPLANLQVTKNGQVHLTIRQRYLQVIDPVSSVRLEIR